MTQQRDADLLARGLLRAVQDDLRRWLEVPQLDHELVAALYLRVIDVLGRRPGAEEKEAVDELALAIYLTASAWQSRSEPPVTLLSSLRQAIASAVITSTTKAPPANGGRTRQTTRSDER